MGRWKKICNANIVSLHEIFTSRNFGDSSLMFSYDYYPLSKTLVEHHLITGVVPKVKFPPPIPERVLWGYICQIANALKAIHSASLAARCVDLSKIILTDKNRIRLAACAILDVVQFETNPKSIPELQQDDLCDFGKSMLCLATNTPPANLTSLASALDSITHKYSARFKETLEWLVTPDSATSTKTIDEFINGLASQMVTHFDSALQHNDDQSRVLAMELENGRVARLMMKLAAICERGDLGNVTNWSETGKRYHLKLFRDFVFHAVDSKANPVMDLGRFLRCLSKLDAGTDEEIVLTTRDNERVIIISYKELKKDLTQAFNELLKTSGQGIPVATD